MKEIKLAIDPSVAVILRSSVRAKRLSLRVSRLDGKVTLTVPKHASLRQAQAFVDEKSGWILRLLGEQAAPIDVETSSCVLFEGRMMAVKPGKRRSARVIGDTILAPIGKTAPSIAALFKTLARDRLSVAVDHYASQVDRRAGRLTLRDTRSRWGSCTAEGNLMFSWRLIMAPAPVLDYVAAHEVAHLVHMDHSKAFWNVVEEICPAYFDQRDWLRREGMNLHRYKFSTR